MSCLSWVWPGFFKNGKPGHNPAWGRIEVGHDLNCGVLRPHEPMCRPQMRLYLVQPAESALLTFRHFF